MTVGRGAAVAPAAPTDRLSLRSGARLTMFSLIATGIALRVWYFLANYSLNHDDICLALNVISRSAGGLMRTLDFDQAAPLGFLLMEHAMVRLMGPGEMALRLIPLICGCLSVVLIAKLATALLPPFEALAVIGFFAFSQAMIESSIQVKPYSLDVLVAIILVSVALPLMQDAASRRERITAAAMGAVSLWVSLPAFFMLFGMAAVIGGQAIVNRRHDAFRRLLPVICAWVISAVGALWFSVKPGLLNRNLAQLDSGYQFPIHVPARIVPWITEAAINLGSMCTSVRLAPLAAVALLFALALMLWNRDLPSLMLAAPIALCLLATIAQLYPWLPRLIFFTAPLALIIIARQVGGIVRERSPSVRTVAASIVAMALIYSGVSGLKNIIVYGSGFDDPRGAVAAIERGWQPGDRIYASDAAMPCIIYYRMILRAPQLDFVSSRNAAYLPNQIERVVPLPKSAGRLWFMFFDAGEKEKDFDRYTLAEFHQAGDLISRSRYKNFVVALWNLGGG
jgi:hypothetical protein